MKTFQLIPMRIFLFLTLFSTLLLTACSDNPAGGDNEHTEPEGLELVHGGEIIYEYTLDNGLTEHSHLHFHIGEEYLFEIFFLDGEGDRIHAENFDESYSLDWDIEHEDILKVHQYEDENRWNFHLEGVAEGGSRVQFTRNRRNHTHLGTPATDEENAIEFHFYADGDGEHNH